MFSDSCINEVVSVGSESLSLGHSDSHIATEVRVEKTRQCLFIRDALPHLNLVLD